MYEKLSQIHIKTLWVVLVLCSISGCQLRSKTLDQQNEYSHFSPTPDTPVSIEFDYPAWWKSNTGWANGNYRISYLEKDLSTPTAYLTENDPLFHIWVKPVSADFSLEKEVEDFTEGFKDDRSRSLVSDRSMEISGYPARRITYKLLPAAGRSEPIIDERVYWLVNNTLYIIRLWILEADRNGPFGQGFDHVIETLQVVK
jgi:hypothetical protein